MAETPAGAGEESLGRLPHGDPAEHDETLRDGDEESVVVGHLVDRGRKQQADDEEGEGDRRFAAFAAGEEAQRPALSADGLEIVANELDELLARASLLLIRRQLDREVVGALVLGVDPGAQNPAPDLLTKRPPREWLGAVGIDQRVDRGGADGELGDR